MAKVQRTNYEWGARSAIQKAIRRSDGDMLAEAIDVLWRLEPSWIFWRMPVLAAEGTPQLMGFICEAANKASQLKKQGDEPGSRKCVTEALQRLCSHKKDLTSWAIGAFLSDCRYNGFAEPRLQTPEQQKRWQACKVAYAMINAGKADSLWLSLRAKAKKLGNRDIMALVDGANRRFSAGGMDGDKVLMAVTSIVALGEYADHDFQDDMADALVPMENRNAGWPWYVYDMHTLLGKRAMSYVCKKTNFPDKNLFVMLWFNFESSRVARGGRSVSYWHNLYLDALCTKYHVSQEKWDKSAYRVELEATVLRFLAEEDG